MDKPSRGTSITATAMSPALNVSRSTSGACTLSLASKALLMRDLAYSITRVLNRDREAVGPWAGLLTDEELLEGLRHMMTLRTFDTRMLMAQRQGKTSFYMQHMGEEAVSCAFRKALRPGDMNFPTYRQAGLLIGAGYPLVDMMCQIYSNELDPLKGWQMPVLYSSKELTRLWRMPRRNGRSPAHRDQRPFRPPSLSRGMRGIARKSPEEGPTLAIAFKSDLSCAQLVEQPPRRLLIAPYGLRQCIEASAGWPPRVFQEISKGALIATFVEHTAGGDSEKFHRILERAHRGALNRLASLARNRL
jgi:hypothetical protein